MKKLMFFLLIFPAIATGATYNIGPGETYTTFADFHANVTPAPLDIVDGGGNTFAEEVVVTASGTSGSQITYQNFIVDATGNNNAIFSFQAGYITYQNITINNATAEGINIFNGSERRSGIQLIDITATGGTIPIDIDNVDGVSITNCSAIGGSYNYSCSVTDSTDVAVNALIAYGAYFGFCTDVSATGVTCNNYSTQPGLQIRGCSGVNTFAVVEANANYRGLYIYDNPGSVLVSNFTANNNVSDSGVEGSGNTGVTLTDGVVSGNANHGLSLLGNSWVLLRVSSVSNAGDGFSIANDNNTLTHCEANTNDVDGFAINGSGNTLSYCYAYLNGDDSNISYGDGYTGHVSAINNDYLYCIADRNRNSGFAFVNSTSGRIINCTIVGNGSLILDDRGGFMSTSSGVWEVKNCIFKDNIPWELKFDATGLSTADMDNNLYHPASDASFYSTGGSALSWSTYVTGAYEPNSVNGDPAFTGATDYHLTSGSTLAIDYGTAISGVHPTVDYDGEVSASPNIDLGVYQYVQSAIAGASGVNVGKSCVRIGSLNVGAGGVIINQ